MIYEQIKTEVMKGKAADIEYQKTRSKSAKRTLKRVRKKVQDLCMARLLVFNKVRINEVCHLFVEATRVPMMMTLRACLM